MKSTVFYILAGVMIMGSLAWALSPSPVAAAWVALTSGPLFGLFLQAFMPKHTQKLN